MPSHIKIDNIDSLKKILNVNSLWVDQFRESRLMQLINDDNKMNNKKIRMMLLSCIQTFSDYFQRTIMLRLSLTDNRFFIPLAQEHLQEEYGHNISLLRERNHQPAKWDPILETSAAWFSWKMLALDNIEKTLLIHLVLETSANIFFKKADEVMQRYKTTQYFAIHAENDEHHQALGMDLLKDCSPRTYKTLAIVQQQGWEILINTCNRIAELSSL